MKFKINYKYKENSGAINKTWEHNYAFITAENQEAAIIKYKKLWTADSELVIKSIETV